MNRPIKILPQYQGSRGPGVTAPSVSSRGIEKIGVPTAGRPVAPNTQAGQWGQRALAQGLSNLSEGLQAVADANFNTLERGRRAGVVEHTHVMEKYLNVEFDALQELRGSDAIGMSAKFADRYEEIREGAIGDPSKFSERSRQDLEKNFAGLFSRTLTRLHGRELKQAEVAIADQKTAGLNRGVAKALQIPMGATGEGLQIIEAIAGKVLDEWTYIHGGELPEEEESTSRSAISEHLLSVAIQRWQAESPAAMRKLWLGRPEYFKSKLPNNYTRLNAKIEAQKSEALIDAAYGTLFDTYGDDYATAADAVIDSEFVKKNLDGDFSAAMRIRDDMYVNAMRAVDRAKKDAIAKTDEAVTNIYKLHYDPKTQVFDNAGAIADVRVAMAKGLIGVDEGEELVNEWKKGDMTDEEINQVYLKIEDRITAGEVPTGLEIHAMVRGDVSIAPFMAYRDKMADERRKAYGGNYLTMALDAFDRYANTLSDSARADMKAEKYRYEKELRAYSRREGVSFFDPKFQEFAEKRRELTMKIGDKLYPADSPEASKWRNMFKDEYPLFMFDSPPGETEASLGVGDPEAPKLDPIPPDEIEPEVQKILDQYNLVPDSQTIHEIREELGIKPQAQTPAAQTPAAQTPAAQTQTATSGSPVITPGKLQQVHSSAPTELQSAHTPATILPESPPMTPMKALTEFKGVLDVLPDTPEVAEVKSIIETITTETSTPITANSKVVKGKIEQVKEAADKLPDIPEAKIVRRAINELTPTVAFTKTFTGKIEQVKEAADKLPDIPEAKIVRRAVGDLTTSLTITETSTPITANSKVVKGKIEYPQAEVFRGKIEQLSNALEKLPDTPGVKAAVEKLTTGLTEEEMNIGFGGGLFVDASKLVDSKALIQKFIDKFGPDPDEWNLLARLTWKQLERAYPWATEDALSE